MESLLNVLGFVFGDWRSLPRLTNVQILSRLERDIWLASASRALDFIHSRSLLPRLIQGMYILRARNRLPPSVCFLNNEWTTAQNQPDLAVVASIMDDIQKRPNEEQRLSRLWIAMRELMAVHYSITSDPDVLRLWDGVLGNWTTAGAWYGLHGDTPLGCLAALNSQCMVRDRLIPTIKSKDEASQYGYPGGALASAKYSIARWLIVSSDKKARLDEALRDVQTALDAPSTDKSGLLAIRGSIRRSAGLISEAIEDYEEVVRLRSDGIHSPGQLGEAESELGYAYLSQLRFRRGLQFCEEGVRKMRSDVRRAGFLVRGLRKLSVAYAANGRLLAAYEVRREAEGLARASAAYDQIR